MAQEFNQSKKAETSPLNALYFLAICFPETPTKQH